MSVSVNVEVVGAEEFAKALNRFDGAMKSRLQQELAGWANAVKSSAERLVPVRTGYLQSTINAKTKDWQVQVSAEASYAAAVEFGTKNSRAQPYLAPAVETHLPNLERVLLDALDSAKMEVGL